MKSLVAYLNKKSSAELRVIAESWQANLTDRLYTGNTFQLAQEMQSEFLQRRLVDYLEPELAQWLEFFISRTEFTISLEELDRLKPASPERDADLKKLKQIGLLFEEKTIVAEEGSPSGQPETPPVKPVKAGWSEIYGWRNRDKIAGSLKTVLSTLSVPREVARPLARLLAEKRASIEPPPDQPVLKPTQLPLHHLLTGLETEKIEQGAESWGMTGLLGSAGPAQLVAELTRAITDQAHQVKILEELGDGSLELFKLLKIQSGKTTLEALLADYVSMKRLGRSLRPLLERLLVWEAFEDGKSLVFIPAEIISPRSEPPVALPEALQTTNPPGKTTLFPPYALAWDILTFLNYIVTNDLKLTNQALIPKRDLKRLNAQLWPLNVEEVPGLEYRHVDFVARLCFNLKLYVTETQTWSLEPGPEFEEWLKLDFYDQMRRLVELWLSEPGRTGPVEFPYYYATNKLISRANKTLLGWLKDCEPGTWYSLDSLVQKIQREDPYFITPRRDLLNMVGLQRLTELSKQWPRIEGEIIQATFQTALEWLGIVQVGRNESDRVVAFCLTSFGAEICGRNKAHSTEIPQAAQPLLVQPNFEVMLFAPKVETVWTLEKFTDLKKLDQVSLYTLTKEAVLRGLESGLTLSGIVDWLQKHNLQPLPQNLAISLEDWSKGFKRVQVEQVTLLEVEDPAVLDELINSKQFAENFERRISPTAALVRLPVITENRRTNSLKTFKNRLRNNGFFAD
jgi:hypothetical protein